MDYLQLTTRPATTSRPAATCKPHFRRSNSLPALETHPIASGVRGRGHYVGTYLAWGSKAGVSVCSTPVSARPGGVLWCLLGVAEQFVTGDGHGVRAILPDRPASASS